MYTNPTAPPLFREIFKNAFLPFKDPSTLGMFLKEIDEFHYSHSEKLGDAFEYLLSFMGSQGDAGQFRTPRHIIDFIVEIVNPRKYETVLDPACGTAGFLIASYKHILARNADKRPGDKLSAKERKALGGNLAGYDISPDMTRLSLVNMYLHQFASPRIHEYDTLSSEDRWNEYYDVILANPPFFSPKGGIKPHSRFGVNSTRAEVLFVDYIMEHLKPQGRAGVVVPEGIVFQTGTAYKLLRRKLVETCLAGVISLPAGVFQPYSGVKTSVLILDKELNAKSDEIFFAKVENDGFSLNDKRTPIEKNDLPRTKELISRFLSHSKIDETSNWKSIEKTGIAERGFILDVSAYLARNDVHSDFEVVKLSEYVEFKRGTSITKKEIGHGTVPVIAGGQKPAYFHNETNRVENSITISSSGAYAGFVAFHPYPIFASDCFTVTSISELLNQKFLFHLLKSRQDSIYKMQSGSGQPHVYARDFNDFEIPLPPIEVQQEIVDELEGYQKVIDGCRQVVESYKPVIDIDPSWEMVELGEICKVGSSKRIFKDEYVTNGIPFYRTKEIVELEKGEPISLELFISEERYTEIKSKFSTPKRNDILISAVGTIGISWVVDTSGDFYFKDGNLLWLREISDDFSPIFIKHTFDALFEKQREQLIHGAAYNALTIQALTKFQVPNLSKDQQMELVSKVEEETRLVRGNKKLIEIFTRKIRDRIAQVWGERGDGGALPH